MRSNAVTEIHSISAVTRIRTWVVSATTRSTNHYTITAIALHDTVCSKATISRLPSVNPINNANLISLEFITKVHQYLLLVFKHCDKALIHQALCCCSCILCSFCDT